VNTSRLRMVSMYGKQSSHVMFKCRYRPVQDSTGSAALEAREQSRRQYLEQRFANQSSHSPYSHRHASHSSGISIGLIWMSDSKSSFHQDVVHLVLGLTAPFHMSLPVLFLAAPRTIRGNLTLRTVHVSNPHLAAIITATSTLGRRPLYIIEAHVFRSAFNLLLRQEWDI
jgi:hypothetical protein